MKDLAIYGAGGFGKEVACLIRKINEVKPTWNIIGFYDRKYERGFDNGYGKVLGSIDDINLIDRDIAIVIALGDTNVTRTIVSAIRNSHVYYPNIIHPNLYLLDDERFSIGRGNIIQKNCAFSCDVVLGDFNVMNGAVVIGHDVHIGSYNSFMPAVRVSGYVTIGDANFFGISSIVLQQLTIGSNVRLGAGSILMTKPKDGNLYMGNPAKRVQF